METAELRLKNNPWTNHFSVAEILSHCMESVAQGAQPGARDLPDQNAFAYSYFQPPRLKWAAENPILEFSLNPSPPAWVDVDRLMFLCEEPLMKQPVFVSEQGWQFAYSPLSLSLVAHRAPYFRFDLQVKGVSRLPAPLSIPLLPPAGFAFFDRNGNIIENDASGMPVAERLHLLAPQAVKIAGAGDQLQLPFRSVLGGAYRLTQIPAGVAEHISLLNEAGESLWISEANNCSLEEPTYLLDIIGGRWGAPVAFRLPVTTFVPKKLRLTNGEVIPLERNDGPAAPILTPSLSRASCARLQGNAGIHQRSVKVSLHHMTEHSGVAIETPQSWQSLDGTSSLETSNLRTSRLIVALADRDFSKEEARFLEGTHVVARPRRFGTILSECAGLGASLWVMSGTYNDYGSGFRRWTGESGSGQRVRRPLGAQPRARSGPRSAIGPARHGWLFANPRGRLSKQG